jgi:hypothetical protein
MTAARKNLLQTYDRTNASIAGHAVSLIKDGIEIILVAAERGQVEHAAKLAGLGEVDMSKVRSVVILQTCSVVNEVKGD